VIVLGMLWGLWGLGDLGGLVRADATADLAAVQAAATGCDAARAHCFGIRLHVAPGEHGLVVSPAWIATQLANANRQFTPLDVGFQLVGVDAASIAHVASRKQRDVLGKQIGGTVIDVFITGQLDDVDPEGVMVYGVTWRRGDRKFIIVSAKAWERTLAHELGHFFGLPHSTYAVSIMNKTERTEPPVDQRRFADEEIAEMKRGLRRLLRAKVIVDVTPA
jgi:hypothetical protein